jgi:hypothetical protein
MWHVVCTCVVRRPLFRAGQIGWGSVPSVCGWLCRVEFRAGPSGVVSGVRMSGTLGLVKWQVRGEDGMVWSDWFRAG